MEQLEEIRIEGLRRIDNQRQSLSGGGEGLKEKPKLEEGLEWLEVEIDRCPNLEEKLSSSLIGCVKKGEMIENLDQILHNLGLRNCKWRFLGGLDVLLECNSKEEAESIVSGKEHGLREWMKEIRYWSANYVVRTRLTWIKLYGLPVDAWSGGNFHKIASTWGTVIKLENCDFASATSLVAGRVLISTCYEFPLEKEVLVKIDNRKVLLMVKDEGWIDEVGDEANNSEEGSSLYPREEEEEDWCDDLSVNNSVDSKSEEEAWMEGDRPVVEEEAWMEGDIPIDVVEECQQSEMFDLGGARTNKNIAAEPKENHEWCDIDMNNSHKEDSGHVGNRNSPCAAKRGNEDNCVGKGIKKEVMQTRGSHEVGVAQVDYLANGLTGEDCNGAKIMEKPQQNNKEIDTEGNRNKKSTNTKVGSQDKDVNRSAKMWDGGMSMRLFNKMFRDRSRRRELFSDRARRSEKTASCRKSNFSGQGSKSRYSTELSEAKMGEDAVDSQSLRELGSKIGFIWGPEGKQGEGITSGTARVNGSK
ncbi:hypothetical protein L1887_17809 [Cichorium endivia]|nr:hypothetical protein L1887_17809 [Cichorium endivia]